MIAFYIWAFVFFWLYILKLFPCGAFILSHCCRIYGRQGREDIWTTRARGYTDDNKGAKIYGRRGRKDIRTTTRAQGYTDNNEGARIYRQQRGRKDIQMRATKIYWTRHKAVRTRARGCTDESAKIYGQRQQEYTDKGARMYKQERKDIRTKATRIYRRQEQQGQ